ncbi:MAG: hypothetical protein JKY53_05740 [Flavobacteriales bacterium]|nr:hypothetical protein [Flavobacteriales bacterium]
MSTSERYLFLLIGVVLFVYLLLRASLVTIVGDEAATFFHYIFPKEFIPGIARRGANNHLLNSIIATELSSIFGYSAFVLRLGNLLSFPLYLFFIYKFIGELKNIILRWILFFGLSTAVLIEFFALCRGYGMSFAFLLGSCWFLYSASRNSKPHFFFLSSLFILFGVAANMTLINTAIIVVGLSTILLVINYGQSKSRKLLLWAGLTIVLGITGISYFSSIALKLHGSGLLYLGNKTNFWDTTLNSIGQSLTHSAFIFRWVFLGLCIFIIIERGVAIWKSAKASALLSPTTLLTTLFFGNIIATILLTTLFEVNYPIARA